MFSKVSIPRGNISVQFGGVEKVQLVGADNNTVWILQTRETQLKDQMCRTSSRNGLLSRGYKALSNSKVLDAAQTPLFSDC